MHLGGHHPCQHVVYVEDQLLSFDRGTLAMLLFWAVQCVVERMGIGHRENIHNVAWIAVGLVVVSVLSLASDLAVGSLGKQNRHANSYYP